MDFQKGDSSKPSSSRTSVTTTLLRNQVKNPTQRKVVRGLPSSSEQVSESEYEVKKKLGTCVLETGSPNKRTVLVDLFFIFYVRESDGRSGWFGLRELHQCSVTIKQKLRFYEDFMLVPTLGD